jgi:hypothetical protein
MLIIYLGSMPYNSRKWSEQILPLVGVLMARYPYLIVTLERKWSNKCILTDSYEDMQL